MSEPFETVNGWQLYAHPLFSETIKKLKNEVSLLQQSDPKGFTSHPKTKFLKRVLDIITKEVPQDPGDNKSGANKYLQGNTLGTDSRHWYRAKFSQRFRIFYRFSSKQKIIIYAWLNDDNTLRKQGAKSDPYMVFIKMLTQGNPPNSWEELLKATTIT